LPAPTGRRPCRHQAGAAQSAGERSGADAGKLGVKQVQDLGEPVGQQRHRQDPLGPDFQGAVDPNLDRAVAAEPDGAHVDGLTMVRQPPTSAPSSATRGRPRANTARSLVVPPMSDRMKSDSPDSAAAPTTLAAGPDSTVSMGLSATTSASARVPSPRTIISGAAIPKRSMASPTPAISMEMRAISRALSAAVRARRGASSAEVSSLDNGDGLARQRHDALSRRQFMRRVAHREAGRHRKGIDVVRMLRDGALEVGEIEVVECRAVVVVAAGNALHRRARQRPGKPGAFRHRWRRSR
jgi:hypothetical protein